ncbi:DUF2500 domain-containing protein [Domibacillus sp. A3M-37]|uniref:DUF2500 domain-containing protein n=1 Tax=Domibacillus sp. A3M-37 TaxID=2962037 RepID=UPI0020B7534E|nr:DUF2500 domain-containing protein [Domibacillus sp. A3M-37]MCP3761417.1 DUF2500 domain-containing protein [Domibacillus sp. A3M-37]
MSSLWADGFGFAPFFITSVFCIVVGVMLFNIVNGSMDWVHNNNSKVMSIPAKVAAKRMLVRGGSGNSAASTRYYITFEYEEMGDRIELQMNGHTYGMIAKEDIGNLTYQGSRYKDFERSKRKR